MKTLFLLVALTATTSVAVHSQSFKVRDVKAPNDKFYDELSHLLGKTITFFYDSSVTITMEGETGTYNLRKESNSIYRRSEKKGTRTNTLILKLNTTFGYINSIELEATVVYTSTGRVKGAGTIIAKRS